MGRSAGQVKSGTTAGVSRPIFLPQLAGHPQPHLQCPGPCSGKAPKGKMGFSHIWWDPEYSRVLETSIPLGCDGPRAGCPAVPIPIAPFKSALQCTAIKQGGFQGTKSCTFLRRLVAFPGGAVRSVGFPLPWRKLGFGSKNCAVVLLRLQ